MTLNSILQTKGSEVYSIGPGATLQDVVERLVEHNIGSLVVCENADPTRMVGIITERDVLRQLAGNGGGLSAIKVADCMTRDVHSGRLHSSIEETMGLMTEKRVRHLPVVEDGRLVGIISIGDLVKSHHAQVAAENHYLKTYIQS